ncbi:helix-turn-helix transcriptional regulator [Sphaerisporangium sp. NPDC088356]|uniref:helix-turn-helix domain-containing protein n=1 Tax=Sphaerisporangium sp. NPDC088356 TaxID=3154871 RepID=UPI003432E962
MPQPVELNPEASPLALFGFEVRRHRLAARLTQNQLGKRILFSTSMVGMVERGERKPERIFAERCDQVLGLDKTMTSLWLMVDRWKESAPRWFREYLDAEQEATAIRSWDPLVLPGLFQIEPYARHVLSGEPGVAADLVEQRLVTRMQRKAVLNRDSPPMVSVVIDEGVLYRSIGGSAVMRQQLEYLLEVAQDPRVTVQVVPFAAESTCGLLGAFGAAELPGYRTIVWVDSSGQGEVTDNPEVVKPIMGRYDAIRADAHPQRVSKGIIEEARAKWT